MKFKIGDKVILIPGKSFIPSTQTIIFNPCVIVDIQKSTKERGYIVKATNTINWHCLKEEIVPDTKAARVLFKVNTNE